MPANIFHTGISVSLTQKICNALLAIIAYLAISATCVAVGFVHSYGPYDYTNPIHFIEKLPVVEKYHFTPEVENLQKGLSSAFIINDLIYTLNSFPNHHRALNAMSRLWRQHKQKGEMPPGATISDSPEHFYEKALAFAPHDPVVKLLYAIHLHAEGDYEKALTQYKTAEEKMGDSAELHYNMGLLYMEMKDIASAKRSAELAYGKDYPLQGLKNRLKKAGAWN